MRIALALGKPEADVFGTDGDGAEPSAGGSAA
jgi:hypothetical protein